MAIGYGERIELENDYAFSNTARLLALKYALDIYSNRVSVGEREKALAVYILKGCASNILVPEMSKLLVANIENIFPTIETKQEIIAGLYNGGLIKTLDTAIKASWLTFANLFITTPSPSSSTPTATPSPSPSPTPTPTPTISTNLKL